jgi:hypothetical protein
LFTGSLEDCCRFSGGNDMHRFTEPNVMAATSVSLVSVMRQFS